MAWFFQLLTKTSQGKSFNTAGKNTLKSVVKSSTLKVICWKLKKNSQTLHGGAGGGGGGLGAASSYPPSFPPLMASLQKVEGSILHKILLDQTGVKLLIFLGKEWTNK